MEQGRIENASQRGMRITAPRAPAMGAVVTVDLRLPSGTTTRIEGRVVFRDEGPATGDTSYAVELTHPNEEYAAFLGLLVAANVRKGTFR